jgi:hypothetical protein
MMKKLLIAAAAAAALVAATPASAQIYLGAQAGGGGVLAGPYDSGARYADPYWNRSTPGGYANGAGGGAYGSGSYGYGSYGSYGYTDPYAAGSAYAYGADCPRVRERIVTRSGRVIYRTRSSCD